MFRSIHVHLDFPCGREVWNDAQNCSCVNHLFESTVQRSFLVTTLVHMYYNLQVLRLSQSTITQLSIGHIVNLCSNDVQRFDTVRTLTPCSWMFILVFSEFWVYEWTLGCSSIHTCSYLSLVEGDWSKLFSCFGYYCSSTTNTIHVSSFSCQMEVCVSNITQYACKCVLTIKVYAQPATGLLCVHI